MQPGKKLYVYVISAVVLLAEFVLPSEVSNFVLLQWNGFESN